MRITDFALVNDVKNEYMRLRQDGICRAAAVDQLLSTYHDEIILGEADDAFLFWIGVADAQYALKELSDEAARKGLHAVQQIEQYFCNISKRDICRRTQWYSAGAMPERKQIKKIKKFRCAWNVGDAFAHQFSGLEADALGLSGKYVILRKVDSIEFGDGRLLPVVTISLWDRPPLPRSGFELSRACMLRLACGRCGNPDTMYEYRAEVLFRNQTQVDKLGLEFIGNYPNIEMPADEVVINHPGMIAMLCPEHLDRDCSNFWKMHDYVCNRAGADTEL